MDNNVADSAESVKSAESLSDDLFHDSVEDRRAIADSLMICERDDPATRKQSRSDLVLDLRNVPSINACPVKSDDDETSEKLSAVIEQPEEHLAPDEAAVENLDDPDKVLRERIETLREVMLDLRQQLRQELTLWRRERDEFQLLRERSDALALEEVTAAARAAAEAYAAESPLSNEIGDTVDLNPVQSLSELTILEYEKKLAKYQDALALAHAEKRYNMRRHVIANTYQLRLLEVERLCNVEFEKIRENANSLRPLRLIASQWCIQDGDGIHADAIHEKIRPVEKSVCDSDTRKTDIDRNGNANMEVNMGPEVAAARFSYVESLKY